MPNLTSEWGGYVSPNFRDDTMHQSPLNRTS